MHTHMTDFITDSSGGRKWVINNKVIHTYVPRTVDPTDLALALANRRKDLMTVSFNWAVNVLDASFIDLEFDNENYLHILDWAQHLGKAKTYGDVHDLLADWPSGHTVMEMYGNCLVVCSSNAHGQIE